MAVLNHLIGLRFPIALTDAECDLIDRIIDAAACRAAHYQGYCDV